MNSKRVYYIKACSFKDYDQALSFLLIHKLRILGRDAINKILVIEATEATREAVEQMLDEVKFTEEISQTIRSLG